MDDRYLLVVNAGSNTLTSFRINADFTLTAVSQAPTGGFVPNSIARFGDLIYVANADEDGVFTNNSDQSGNVVGLRLDIQSGQLTPIPSSSRSLGVRPSNIEFTPDGRQVIVSGLNAGGARLAGGSLAELSSYGVRQDGSLTATAQATAISTLPNNPQGRNLPNAIGIETFLIGARQFVIAAESRSVQANGQLGGFATLQTSSVSTWEIAPGGSFTPRAQDVLFGPTTQSGALQAGWIAGGGDTGADFMVSTSTGATIASLLLLDADGGIAFGGNFAQGAAVAINAPSPLANADGFIDLVVSDDGRHLYQLVGLKGRVDVYALDILGSFKAQEATTSLLPMDNLQGIAIVDARP